MKTTRKQNLRMTSTLGLVALAAFATACGGPDAGDIADEDLLSEASALNVAATWTVVHGGAGQIVLVADGSYTSSCVRSASFPLAHCPATQGKWSSPTGSAYVTFYGADGTVRSYRASGPVSAPTSLTEISQYYNGLIISRGTTFTCSNFYDSAYAFAKGPIADACKQTHACLLGSGADIGVNSASNYRSIAEIRPDYFVLGRCP